MSQFKIDENLPIDVAELLVAAGSNAMTVIDQELGGKADDVIAQYCREEGRALITMDLGFGYSCLPASGLFGLGRASTESS
jgi:predicted nuclease of predicted toxin-antitoxin system